MPKRRWLSGEVGSRVAVADSAGDIDVVSTWLKRVVEETALEVLPKLIGELQSATASAWVRLVHSSLPTATQGDSPAALCTARQMAEQLRVPESWVREQA